MAGLGVSGARALVHLGLHGLRLLQPLCRPARVVDGGAGRRLATDRDGGASRARRRAGPPRPGGAAGQGTLPRAPLPAGDATLRPAEGRDRRSAPGVVGGAARDAVFGTYQLLARRRLWAALCPLPRGGTGLAELAGPHALPAAGPSGRQRGPGSGPGGPGGGPRGLPVRTVGFEYAGSL